MFDLRVSSKCNFMLPTLVAPTKLSAKKPCPSRQGHSLFHFAWVPLCGFSNSVGPQVRGNQRYVFCSLQWRLLGSDTCGNRQELDTRPYTSFCCLVAVLIRSHDQLLIRPLINTQTKTRLVCIHYLWRSQSCIVFHSPHPMIEHAHHMGSKSSLSFKVHQ